MSLFRKGFLLLVALTVTACGFQMRSAPELPSAMDKTYVASSDRQSLFYRKLTRELRNNGVALLDSPVDATAVLTILEDETGQRVLSVSARNIPREFEVFYRVSVSLQEGERIVMEPREQAVARDYTYDETLVLGKAQEEEQIRDAIADDLVRLVMFQLAAL